MNACFGVSVFGLCQRICYDSNSLEPVVELVHLYIVQCARSSNACECSLSGMDSWAIDFLLGRLSDALEVD
jgi:hypothetical protein